MNATVLCNVADTNPHRSNAPTKDDALALAQEQGHLHGAGGDAKHNAALALARCTQNGALSGDPRSSDVDDFYNAFRDASRTSRSSPHSKDLSEGTIKKDRSEFRVFAICGAHPQVDGVDTLDRALSIINAARARGDITTGTFNALVPVARAQNAAKVALTNDDIRALVYPKGKNPPSVFDEVNRHLEAIQKMLEGSQPSPSSPGKMPLGQVCGVTAQRIEAAVSALTMALSSAPTDKTRVQS